VPGKPRNRRLACERSGQIQSQFCSRVTPWKPFRMRSTLWHVVAKRPYCPWRFFWKIFFLKHLITFMGGSRVARKMEHGYRSLWTNAMRTGLLRIDCPRALGL